MSSLRQRCHGEGTDRGGGRAERGTSWSPGSPCPFCRFPTHDWEPDPAGLPAGLLAEARTSDPAWTPDRGICGQCSLLFRGRVPPARIAESLPA